MCTLAKQKALIGAQQIKNQVDGRFYLGVRYANKRGKVVAHAIFRSNQPISMNEMVVALAELKTFVEEEVAMVEVEKPYFNHNYAEDMVAALEWEFANYGLIETNYTTFIGRVPLA